MIQGTIRSVKQQAVVGSCLSILLALLSLAAPVAALTPLPTPDPKPGAYGLEATKKQAPPTRGATITTPGTGSGFTTSPITVNGTCPSDLLVQIFNNGVMVGAVMCRDGSFSIQVSLFSGKNQLSAKVYDDIGQTGPASNTVTVTYSDTHLTEFGQLITLTSQYGRLSAAATTQLTWPLQLSGGTGPYAFSIDWGDGSKPELKSQALAGLINISHVYKKAGIYLVNIKVTDVNGVSAFLQLVAVASGKVDTTATAAGSGDHGQTGSSSQPKILWIPMALLWLLLIPSYWLGRHSMRISIRNKMLKERDTYEKEATEATHQGN